MNRKNSGYMRDVDELIESTSCDLVLNHFGKPLPKRNSVEHRMECVFNENCADSNYGNLSVKLDDAVNRIYCHACGIRGNLLTLIHGLEHHVAPKGGRLRGDEFKHAVAILREIAANESRTPRRSMEIAEPIPAERPINLPLVRHEKEAARNLADLCDDLITDFGEMSPRAAEYVRRRSWMTPELMKKWGVGWIPGNGRSLFRKGYLVYTHRNERGEVLSYSGRDLSFEEKLRKWVRDGRPEGKRPGKHRYVQGFQRGLELYGGHAGRLKEPYVKESLAKRGVVVAEGMNEVLRMETLGVAAVGLGSNKATDAQLEKIVRFARQAGKNRLVLLPDCDEEGEAGFNSLLWKLNEARIQTRIACSSQMFDGKFAGKQPEDFSDEDWGEIDAHIVGSTEVK